MWLLWKYRPNLECFGFWHHSICSDGSVSRPNSTIFRLMIPCDGETLSSECYSRRSILLNFIIFHPHNWKNSSCPLCPTPNDNGVATVIHWILKCGLEKINFHDLENISRHYVPTAQKQRKVNKNFVRSFNRFQDNGVWQFVSITTDRIVTKYSCCPAPYYDIIFTITFTRNSGFYVSYLIIPCVLLSALTLLVFWLPPDCGEKLTLSITNLLAMVVFQQLIAETMPPTADESPLLGRYVFAFVICNWTKSCCK